MGRPVTGAAVLIKGEWNIFVGPLGDMVQPKISPLISFSGI